MKILITGSSGFLGRRCAEYLIDEGHFVIGYDRAEPPNIGGTFQHVSGDILDEVHLKETFERARPSAVIHFAARVDLLEKQDLSGYRANTDGTRFLCHAIRDVGTVQRAIFTSSQLVCAIGYVPRHPTDYCPDTLYGKSKAMMEDIVREEEGGGAIWAIARPTTVWGPGMSAHYQRALDLLRRGLYFHVTRHPLEKTYGYIDNVVYQYGKLLTADSLDVHGKVFYTADYEPITLQRYMDGLAKRLGAPSVPTIPLTLAKGLALIGDLFETFGWDTVPFNTFRLNNILTEYVQDTSNTESVCGHLPYTLEEGLDATVEWFMASKKEKGDNDGIAESLVPS